MAKMIVAVIEQRDGKIKKAGYEAASTAAALASKLGCPVAALIPASTVENPEKIANYGISDIKILNASAFANYSQSGYAGAIVDQVNAMGADVLVFANTAMGKDLAPFVAAKLNAGVVADATHIDDEGGKLTAIRPIFAGKALQEVVPTSEIKVFSLRPNVFPLVESSVAPAVTTIPIDSPDLSSAAVEIKKAGEKLDVAEADIVVSGGRGLKDAEQFRLIEELAAVLGGAVGASRAVVDAGWRPHSEQVGQTGKTVTPSLYIACGISGAIQHLAGMTSSKYIVAINKDKDAPIFSIADYGITGDVFEVLPPLIEELKKVVSH